MRVYIVELSEYDGNSIYGVYSSLELAKLKLNSLYIKVSKECREFSDDEYKRKTVWKSETSFDIEVKLSKDSEFASESTYLISEYDVDKNE